MDGQREKRRKREQPSDDVSLDMTFDDAVSRLVGRPVARYQHESASVRENMPPIICICGSMRWSDEMKRQRERLTREGKIIVGPEIKTEDAGLKQMLDELHLRKIDLATEVFVVNADSQTDQQPHIGDSTTREIAYAKQTGKPVSYLVPPN